MAQANIITSISGLIDTIQFFGPTIAFSLASIIGLLARVRLKGRNVPEIIMSR